MFAVHAFEDRLESVNTIAEWDAERHEHVWQASLFGCADPSVDLSVRGITRIQLDESSWLDHLPGWLRGADVVFAELVARLSWTQRQVVMYDRLLDEPRLSAWWSLGASGAEPLPVLGGIRTLLGARYGREFDSIGFNLYRDGHDSVAWHGDRNRFWSAEPVVATVSVGSPRPFLVRPRGGGASYRFDLGDGDLMVMGGECQHRWEHCVPKVARAGPRLAITYRHGADQPSIASYR
jgi:alkylated DNA repair dioxygenase AlkB